MNLKKKPYSLLILTFLCISISCTDNLETEIKNAKKLDKKYLSTIDDYIDRLTKKNDEIVEKETEEDIQNDYDEFYKLDSYSKEINQKILYFQEKKKK